MYLVNETPAALWAIVELNLWVIVASIPSLRPLITKALRDRRERRNTPRSKSYTYGSRSMKSLKARLWPRRARSSAQLDGRLPLDGEEPREAVAADASPSAHGYDVQVSAPNATGPAWTPLGAAEEGRGGVQLQELGRIRVYQEINVSPP